MARKILCCVVLFGLVGCAYRFQGQRNPLREMGVQSVYVEQFRNLTYRPGLEQLFSAAMIREIQKHGAFRLVEDAGKADAILRGELLVASSEKSSSRRISLETNKEVDVASEFNAIVSCNVSLSDQSGRLLFQQSIASNKIYPGAVRIREEGATVPLTNDSEQRLAVQFLASQMMASLYQRMVDIF